ncbi:MAG: IS1380 family transposase [Bacteroidia bacterium]
MSTEGGALLLREVAEQTGLLRALAAAIVDHRDPRYVEHSIESLISQRVFQISCGYEDGNDCTELRSDLGAENAAPFSPSSGQDLASQPMMCRFENAVSRSDLYRIAEVLAHQFVASYGEKEPPVIILDCDDTNNNAFGDQEQIVYNHYYGEYCFMPLHIYEGLSGKLITAILKPGRRSKSADVFSILQRVICFLRQHWKHTRIIVRGDSHFCSPELLDWAQEMEGVSFLTGLGGNPKLNKMVASTLRDAKIIFAKTGEKVKLYTDFMYQAGSWKHPQRVVAKVEYSEKGANIRYIVSDFQCGRKYLYEKFYCARGAMELYIKDHKTYLKSDRSSCSSFEANQFRLFLHSAAYVLIHSLQKELFKATELTNATMETIQLKVLKIATRVYECKHKIKVVFPACTAQRHNIQRADDILGILSG